MQFLMDRNRVYLVLFYFSMSFFYLSFVLGGPEDPVPMLGYILALITFIVLSHDSLLQIIVQATGHVGGMSELTYFNAFMDLNRKIHNFLGVDEVLRLVNETLKEKVQVSSMTCLISKEVKGDAASSTSADSGQMHLLTGWPGNKAWQFHTVEFEQAVVRHGRVVSIAEAPAIIRQAFTETETSLLVPVIQNGNLLCIILIERSDRGNLYSQFEYQIFSYLANQLSIILDRIRVYAKVMHQTEMENAEKIQVMQSLSANIAHEMRTPLSGIRASITGLEEYLPQLLDSHQYGVAQLPGTYSPIRENHLAALQGTPRRIQLMIDQANTVIDMLLMNLRDNALDRMLLTHIDAAALVTQAVDRYPFKTGEREKLTLNLDDNFRFSGIESLCVYVLFNLLKNAIYSIQSARKGGITITLESGEHQHYLHFRDSGLGMEPAILAKIFDGFFTTKNDGTGAGLAFCKRTIQSFDGEIRCESVAGEYAEFIISLPAIQNEPVA